jgi:phage terminase Nu1 subunit (DNA packaging protein)
MVEPKTKDADVSFADRLESQLGKRGIRALHVGHSGNEQVCGRCASEIARYLDSQLMATHALRIENERLRERVTSLVEEEAETQSRLTQALAQVERLELEKASLKTVIDYFVRENPTD